MEVRIHGDDAVHDGCQHGADGALADRLARVKRSVLPHVAEIGRDQDQSLCPAASQCLCGEQQRDQLVVGPIERGMKDGLVSVVGATVTRSSPSGNVVHIDLAADKPKPRRQPLRRVGAGGQGLERDRAHGNVLPWRGIHDR